MNEHRTMDPENYARVCELFEAARRLDVGTRGEFLDRECCDTPLVRAEVQHLIAQDEAAEREAFLESPSPFVAVNPSRDAPELLLGTQIGPYRIDRLVASGGMGHVYLARRIDHYNQEVALKVIRHGSSDLLHRFHAERQVLARLQHPHIARLLDGGDTPDGKPWLVMEYIDGVPIDQHCDQHQLSTLGRVALMQRVSSAVQYAHDQAILHRDLKPSNLLVTRDGT